MFATDSDFLTNPSIRAIFFQNSLCPADAALLTIPEFKGEQHAIAPILVKMGPQKEMFWKPNQETISEMKGFRRFFYAHKVAIILFSMALVLGVSIWRIVYSVTFYANTHEL